MENSTMHAQKKPRLREGQTKPGLVAFYDIRPGNRPGRHLFLQPRSYAMIHSSRHHQQTNTQLSVGRMPFPSSTNSVREGTCTDLLKPSSPNLVFDHKKPPLGGLSSLLSSVQRPYTPKT